MMLPLQGITVLELAQFMAGPSAGLRLADLGARVIKIERPKTGEAGRGIALKNLFVGGSSLVFHTANRNKESYTANLKNPEDLKRVEKLIAHADVMTHNFRPGVMEKIGLDFQRVKKLNPRIVYGVVTGFGSSGPWAKKPGQDLLIQSISGFVNLTGNRNDSPIPVGAAISDISTGAHLVQGIIAALIRREKTGVGALVEVSLLESTLDLQTEVITTFLNDGHKSPERASRGSAHAYLSAPYGIYQTRDGFIALAMGSVTKLGDLLRSEQLKAFKDKNEWFSKRDEIMQIIQEIFKFSNTEYWLSLLKTANFWCSEVMNYKDFISSKAFETLNITQSLTLINGEEVRTTRCPIRINDQRLFSSIPAPEVGQHTESIINEFDL